MMIWVTEIIMTKDYDNCNTIGYDIPINNNNTGQFGSIDKGQIKKLFWLGLK